MNKFLISPLLLTLFIQGCGGSSSSAPEIPVEPVEYSFSLTSKLTNDCGVNVAFTEVELLLQDETWQTLTTYKSDENGLISFVTESEFINYTLVAKNQQGTEVQGLNVVSFYQASSATPAHYQAEFDDLIDNASCQCEKQDVKLNHNPMAMERTVTHSSSIDEWMPIDDSNTLFKGVTVCRAIDGNWPLHSFSVEGLDFNQDLVAVGQFLDLNTFVSGDGAWLISAILPAKKYELNPPYQEITSVQLIDGDRHFATEVAKGVQSLLVFTGHKYVSETYYQSQASVAFDERDSVVRSSVVKTTHQIVLPEAQESLAVKSDEQRPPIDDIGITEIKSDGRYDYSAVVGFPMAVISYTFLAFDSENRLFPAKWTFYGQEQGMLAINVPLSGYENIINIDTRKEAIGVHLVKSMATNNYQDYIKYYQGNSSADMSNDFVKNINEVILSIKY